MEPQIAGLTIGQIALLRALKDAGARALIVGGQAVRFHGHNRPTTDLDLYIGFDGENLAAAIFALDTADPMPFRRQLPVGPPQRYKQLHGELAGGRGYDYLTDLRGLDFEQSWGRRCTAYVGDLEVAVLSREDLLTTKAIGDRARDAEDYEALKDGGGPMP